MAFLLGLVGVLALLAVPGAAQASWQPAGQPTTTADSAVDATVIGGVPHAAWTELGAPDHVEVASWNGSGWTPVVGALNVSAARFAAYPSITNVNDEPWVAFIDRTASRDEVRVAKPSAGAWQLQGAALNTTPGDSASDPRIASVGDDDVPYVAFLEAQPGTGINWLRVRRWNGSVWESVGGNLNIGAFSAKTPSIVDVEGVAHVAWSEFDGTGDLVRVARWTGTAWEAVGGPVVHAGSVNSVTPALAVDSGVPYVAWAEARAGGGFVDLRVARLSGVAWSELGTGPADSQDVASFSGVRPALTVAGGRPTVGWTAPPLIGAPPQVRVANWNGRVWTRIGAGSLNRDPTESAGPPSAVPVSGAPFVVWPEYDGASLEVNASRLVTDAATAALRFSAATFSVRESEGSVVVTVQRTGGTAGAVAVNYDTSSGSAVSGADYTATSGALTFADGDPSKSFVIPVAADGVGEVPETFSVTLSSPGGDAVLGAPATATVTIADDDIDTRITSGPDGPTSNSAPTFGFVAEPALGATFACAIDGAAFAACTSPRTVEALADGQHTFTLIHRSGGLVRPVCKEE